MVFDIDIFFIYSKDIGKSVVKIEGKSRRVVPYRYPLQLASKNRPVMTTNSLLSLLILKMTL